MTIDPINVENHQNSNNNEVLELTNGFFLSENGKEAYKEITIRDQGLDHHFVMTVNLGKKDQKQVIALLESMDDKKAQFLARCSYNLGLGQKYDEVKIFNNKVIRTKTNGSVKVLDSKYLEGKQSFLGNNEKMLQKRELFFKIQMAFNQNIYPDKMPKLNIPEKDLNILKARELGKKLAQNKEKLKEMGGVLDQYYVGDKPIKKLIDKYMKKHPKITQEEIQEYTKKLMEREDFHKKEE